jgi:hypothetical protein
MFVSNCQYSRIAKHTIHLPATTFGQLGEGVLSLMTPQENLPATTSPHMDDDDVVFFDFVPHLNFFFQSFLQILERIPYQLTTSTYSGTMGRGSRICGISRVSM